MHAITLGDTIVIRETHASNVRILREELIHAEQQASGVAIAGRDTITHNLPAIMRAIEEFKTNRPVTQRSQTGALMVVKEDQELGVLIVVCDERVVYRSRFKGGAGSDRP